MWDLAPHDVSMIAHVTGKTPLRVLNATGAASEFENIYDIKVAYGSVVPEVKRKNEQTTTDDLIIFDKNNEKYAEHINKILIELKQDEQEQSQKKKQKINL